MGLIIAPIFLGVLIICIFSGIQVNKWYGDSSLNLLIITSGLILSLTILIGIGVSYYFKQKVYALSPMFRIPIWLFYIPGVIGLILLQFQHPILIQIAKTLITSIIISAVISLVFNKYIFGILDYLKIEKYY